MLKRYTVFFVLLSSLMYFQLGISWEFTDKEGNLLQLQVCQENDLIDCRQIFIDAFSKAYEDFSEEQLGVQDKLQFLEEAFIDVYDDMKLGLQDLIVAKKDDKVVGFVGFKRTDVPHQIYISQLAVSPLYWQNGIGSHLVFSVFDLYEDVQRLAVIPRRINEVARRFYTKLNFFETDYMHPGYSQIKYVGYEWVKP